MSFDILCNPFSVLRHVHPRAAGRIAYIAGFGGGGKSTPTDQTITQTTLPEEFRPFFERLMGRVEEQSKQGYQPYGGRRLAPMSDFADITKSQDMVRGVAGKGIAGLDAAQTNAAANMAKANELGNYGPGTFTEYGGYKAGKADPYAGFTAGTATPYAGFTGSNYTESNFGPAGEFTSAEASKYMNPYMQNVVDVEKRRADEDYNIARLGRSSRAVNAGAFGGSRGAVQEGLAERDLLERQGGIQARGLSTAYTDAQGMFSADRAARLGVEQARAGEAGRVQSGTAGEAARVQGAEAAELARTQEIGLGEAARVQGAQAEELGRTQGINLAEDARVQQAKADELARVQTGTEASRQFGAGQGIAALDASRAAGTQLVGLGEKEREAQIQNAQLLDTIGREQRGEAQTGLDIGYQDFLRQQGYPEEQLAFFSNMLQGLPVQATGTTTSTGSTYTNPAQQAVGAGLAGLSLYKAYT